jgi:hypothetical protein
MCQVAHISAAGGVYLSLLEASLLYAPLFASSEGSPPIRRVRIRPCPYSVKTRPEQGCYKELR